MFRLLGFLWFFGMLTACCFVAVAVPIGKRTAYGHLMHWIDAPWFSKTKTKVSKVLDNAVRDFNEEDKSQEKKIDPLKRRAKGPAELVAKKTGPDVIAKSGKTGNGTTTLKVDESATHPSARPVKALSEPVIEPVAYTEEQREVRRILLTEIEAPKADTTEVHVAKDVRSSVMAMGETNTDARSAESVQKHQAELLEQASERLKKNAQRPRLDEKLSDHEKKSLERLVASRASR